MGGKSAMRIERASLILLITIGGGLLGGCSSEDEGIDGFTEAEWAKIQTLSPLPAVPPDPTNQYADDPAAAVLGQRFFHEKGYSGPIIVGADGMNGGLGAAGETGKIACASCHQGTWMIDQHSGPNNATLGADWLPRNATTPINASFYAPWFENDGLSDSQWADALVDPELSLAMNGSRLKVVHLVYTKYRADYEAIFPPLDPALDPAHADAARFPPEGKPKAAATEPDGPWEMMAPEDQEIATRIFVNFGKAIQAYVRTLVSRDAPFDRYVAGDVGAISAEAKRGLDLFIGKANCVACHSGPLLSDNNFHNTAIAAEGPHIIPDETGRHAAIGLLLANPFNSDGEYSDDRNTKILEGLVATDQDIGRWRTKGLREIAETAPYSHTGQFATLQDLLEFYNEGGAPSGFVGKKDELMVPLNLTPDEITDLEAFLGTLTGAPVPAALQMDTSAP